MEREQQTNYVQDLANRQQKQPPFGTGIHESLESINRTPEEQLLYDIFSNEHECGTDAK